MKVLCIKNTTKLVKGATYDVLQLKAARNGNTSNYRPFVVLSIGRYSPNNFTNLDGTKISEIDWSADDYTPKSDTWKLRIQDVRLLTKGELIKCTYSSGKFFEEDKMYEVSDIMHKETMKASYSGGQYKSVERKIKVKGYNRWINPYRFRQLSTQEKRNLSLSGIFGEKVEVADMEEIKNTRKIDRISKKEKNKVIIWAILSSIVDTHRNSLSITDWALQKKGASYGMTIDDIKPLLNKKLSDILKLVE